MVFNVNYRAGRRHQGLCDIALVHHHISAVDLVEVKPRS